MFNSESSLLRNQTIKALKNKKNKVKTNTDKQKAIIEVVATFK